MIKRILILVGLLLQPAIALAVPDEIYVDPAINAASGSGTIGDPYGDVQHALDNVNHGGDGARINVKAGTAEVLVSQSGTSNGLSLDAYNGTNGAPGPTEPIIIQGYTSAAGDGGIAEFTGTANGVAFWVDTTTGGADVDNAAFIDLKITTAQASGYAINIDNYITVLNVELISNHGGMDIDQGIVDHCNITYVDSAGVVGSGSNPAITNTIFTQASGALVAATNICNPVINNIFNVRAATDASVGVVTTNTTSAFTIMGNSFFGNFSSGGAAARAITLSGSCQLAANNYIEGFNSTADYGIGILSSSIGSVLANNKAFNNTAFISNSGLNTIIIGDHTTQLVASGVTDAAGEDYTPTTTLIDAGYPSDFLELAGNATYPTVGAITTEHEAAGGGTDQVSITPFYGGDIREDNGNYIFEFGVALNGVPFALDSGAIQGSLDSAADAATGLTLNTISTGRYEVVVNSSNAAFDGGGNLNLTLSAGTVGGNAMTGAKVGEVSIARFSAAPTNFESLSVDGSGAVIIQDGTDPGQIDTDAGAVLSTPRSAPHVWYVDDGGNDSNDGKTVGAPKLTIAATVTAASPGDVIFIGAGTYSGALSTSKHNLTFIGDSSANTTITHSSGYTWTLTGNHCTLRNLSIVASAETSSGTGLNVSSTIGTTIDQCVIDGKFDGLLSSSAEKLTITRSKVKGTYDAANFNTVRQLRCEDVDFLSTADHSTDAEFRAVVIVESNTTIVQSVGQHLFVNCDFAVTRTGTSATDKDTIAVRAAGRPMFIGCNFRSRATNASYTGNVRGLVGEGLLGSTPFYPGYTTVRGGSVRCATAGSGTAVDMLTSVSEAEIHVDGANYTTASGNVYNDGPTAALVNTEVEAGQVGTDAAAILVDTAEIGAAGAGLTNINLPNQTMDIVGNITGNLSGSVGSVGGTVGGIAGTITTLDALDTAQDTQHGTTQTAIADVPTVTEFNAGLAALPQTGDLASEGEIADAVLDEALAGHSTSGTLGKAMTDTLTAAGTTIPALIGTPDVTLADDIADIGTAGATQPRINRKPDPGFTIQVSRRADGTYKCKKPIRLTAGAISQVYAFIDMAPLFGAENFVETVGTPVVSGGSVTASATGPRDTYAIVELDGTATAGEERTVTVPVTMTSGTQLNVVFDLEVFE